MRKSIVTVAMAGLLVGCSGSADEANETGDASGSGMPIELAGGSDIALQPGKWEQKITFAEFDMPGVPENMKDMVASRMGGGMTVTHCLSQADVEEPDPGFFGSENPDGCSYEQFSRSGNKMTIKMTCDLGEGRKSSSNLEGEFGSDSYTMNIENQTMGGAEGNMSMKGSITGHRVGDC
jgi:hypothetical protein